MNQTVSLKLLLNLGMQRLQPPPTLYGGVLGCRAMLTHWASCWHPAAGTVNLKLPGFGQRCHLLNLARI
jgi:hypothetical protein